MRHVYSADGPVTFARRQRGTSRSPVSGTASAGCVISELASLPGAPVTQHLDLMAGLTNLGDQGPPFVSSQPLTTDTATYDIIGRTYYVGFKGTF